mgnify:CR=1 FL=1
MKQSKFMKSLLVTSPLLVLAACSDSPQQSADKAAAMPEKPAVMSSEQMAVPAVAQAPKAEESKAEPSATSADKAAYDAALAAANEAVDKAASVGGEWRDTRWKKSTFVKWTSPSGETVKGSFMTVAAKAAEAGDYAKAVELLETARFQGEMGYEQAMAQKQAGPVIGKSASAAAAAVSGDKDGYEELLKSTIAAADKAASVGGEWRDTRWKKSTFVKWVKPDGSTEKGSYVVIAEKAAASGDYTKAIELLEMAKFQADMGYAQAMEQQNAGPKLN